MKSKFKLNLLFLMVIVVLFSSSQAQAVSIDKNYYASDERVYSTSAVPNPIVIYNVNSGVMLSSRPNISDGEDLTVTNDPGDYSVVEVTSDICGGGGLSYDDCVAQADFLGEARFTILAPGASIPLQGGVAPITNSSYAPIVTILSPGKNSVFSRLGTIKYKVIDWNDKGAIYEKDNAGLVANPVSLFYSDKLGDNLYSFVDPKLKLSIVKGLPAIGSYDWATNDLIPGAWYRLVVDAVDLDGLIGESVSSPFSVDFTPPVFTVTTDPPAIRKGNISIYIESSKELSAPPEVKVTQNGGSPTALVLTGEKTLYKGIYKVISGFDGTAHISVSGSDTAGNISTTTVSGGTFSVGENPPPAPVITSPTPKSSVAEDYIDIRGTARDDTTLLLKVNATNIAEVKPNSSGVFFFPKVAIDAKKNRGVNFISISARDALGVVGPATEVEVKRNIPPTITLVKPTQDEIVNDEESITVNGEDGNSDSLLYTYEIQLGRTLSESSWIVIGDAVPSSGLIWNASEVDDGEYSIRVIADDGYSKATSSTVRFTVRNTAPFFRFEDGRKTVTKSSNPTIVGRVLSSNNIGIRPSIDSAEYSINNGIKWVPLKLETFPSLSERKFSLTLSDLKEGTYPILFRVKDARGNLGKTIHPVSVDTIAPSAPFVSSLRDGAVLSEIDDQDLSTIGMQTSLSGTAEPGTTITLSYDGTKATTKTLANGRFNFSGITFMARGAHTLNLFAVDEAGNVSKSLSFNLIYDNPPVITMISPKPFHGLATGSHIKWTISDIDGDTIGDTTVSYRKYGGVWKNIATHVLPSGEVAFDTKGLPEANDYEISISTTDGITPVSLSTSFSVDETKPVVESLVEDKKSSVGLSASGTASDNASGVEFVEFSIHLDGESDVSTWYKALITKGFGGTHASYLINYPITVEDGTYVLSVRALDEAGNISDPISRRERIDRTAPRVGSFFVEAGGMRLIPDSQDSISIPGNITLRFNISLESDTASSSLLIDGKYYALVHDFTSGLWTLSLPPLVATSTGNRLVVIAEDEGHNKLSGKDLGRLVLSERGSLSVRNAQGILTPVRDGRIRVLKWNEEAQRYTSVVTSEGKLLEVSTDETGGYDLTLSQGKYRLIATKTGMKTLVQSIELDRAGSLDIALITEPISGIRLFIQGVRDWFR